MPDIDFSRPLTDMQRKQLIMRAESINVNTLAGYVLAGQIDLDRDLPNLSAERRNVILKMRENQPNPAEQRQWRDIEALLPTLNTEQSVEQLQMLLRMLENYIRSWETERPNQNHVDDANQYYIRTEDAIRQKVAALEDADWQTIDFFSLDSLTEHLTKYPQTSHQQEIDDALWQLTDKESVAALKNYLTLLPNGCHQEEAQVVLKEVIGWQQAKDSGDIFAVDSYIHANPSSPFMQQAELLRLTLKQEEIKNMREDPNRYEVERLKTLLTDGIISENELYNAKVITPSVFETLMATDIRNDLPDIRKAIADSKPDCQEGYTDVFFFGVPSTGKTCVLMGLSRSQALRINLAHGGGDYAAALQQYTDAGITVPRTPGTFVTTLAATVSSQQRTDAFHKINLVEMSGEEFAFSIANNENHVFTFEDMGSGATELLKNNNRKVFFLVIDPTANVVRINRERITGYDEMTGKPIVELEWCVVNQRTILQKMVNLLENPANAEIMKKVDAIHIIITKSDMLGGPVEREERAFKIFQEKYRNDILEPLVELCQEYNINAPSKYHPKLYTFSLGTFYVGGIYEYDQTDSNRLVKAIRNSTEAIKKASLWERIKDTVN